MTPDKMKIIIYTVMYTSTASLNPAAAAIQQKYIIRPPRANIVDTVIAQVRASLFRSFSLLFPLLYSCPCNFSFPLLR